MISFKKYNFKLLEEAFKLKHLTHVEDLVWIYGKKGGQETIKFLEITLDELKGHKVENAKTFQKVDGAPAIIAGWSPENGEFFVATKSLFNKTPKINFTNDDIDINHGHSAGLSKKLKEALEYLPDVIKKGKVLMGDFMYSKDDLVSETIDGVKGISYKPNTITYFVDATSGLYKRITGSQIGIIFHTSYNGGTISDLSATYAINESDLKYSKDVYVRTTNVKSYDSVDFSDAEFKLYKSNLKELKVALSQFSDKELSFITDDEFLSKEIQTYINFRVREGKHFSKNEISNVIDFITAKFDKAIDKLKSDKGKSKKESEKQDVIGNIQKSGGTMYYLFKWFESAANLKMLLLDKLNQVKAPETPYIKEKDKYVITDPEGYVISSSSDNGVKFVNRAVFSKINMLGSDFNK